MRQLLHSLSLTCLSRRSHMVSVQVKEEVSKSRLLPIWLFSSKKYRRLRLTLTKICSLCIVTSKRTKLTEKFKSSWLMKCMHVKSLWLTSQIKVLASRLLLRFQKGLYLSTIRTIKSHTISAWVPSRQCNSCSISTSLRLVLISISRLMYLWTE